MQGLFRIYRYINLLSLDIAVGAVTCASFFASLLHVTPRPQALLSLGLTVWIIYTTDHLLDARNLQGRRASTERHRFHQDNFQLLTWLTGAALVLDVIAVFYIKKQVLYGGVMVIAVVGVYLVVHNRLAFLKELFVAVLYCLGVLLPSVPVAGFRFTQVHYMLFLVFFLIALINLLIFSWFDRHEDDQDDRRSFVTLLGTRPMWVVVYCAFVIGFSVLTYLALDGTEMGATVTLFAMMSVLFGVGAFREWFSKKSRYRIWGDAVFLFPLIYLLCAGSPIEIL